MKCRDVGRWFYRLPGGIWHGPYPSEERARDVMTRQLRIYERRRR